MGVRQDILDALRNDFGDITVTNGYVNTIKRTVYTGKALRDLNEADLDFAYIFPLPEKQNMLEDAGMWTWSVGFAVYFATGGLDSDESGLIETKAEAYIEDIKAKFTSNATHVYNVSQVESIMLETLDPYFNDETVNIGIVYGNFLITYIYQG